MKQLANGVNVLHWRRTSQKSGLAVNQSDRNRALRSSLLGSLRNVNGLIYIRVGGRKLLCFEQFPETIFCGA